MGKTQQALDLVRQGLTPYAAAKEIGIQPPTVYRALARERKRLESEPGSVCPCCKRPMPSDKNDLSDS